MYDNDGLKENKNEQGITQEEKRKYDENKRAIEGEYERGRESDREREGREVWVIHGLGSQFFIASSDLPSQEYFLALPKAFPLAHDPTGSPCIRDTGVELRDYYVEDKKEQFVAPQISCGVNADTCLPFTPQKKKSSPCYLLSHTHPPRYVFPAMCVPALFFFFSLAFIYLASSFCFVSLQGFTSFFPYLLLHYSLIVNLRIIYICIC